MHHARTHAVQRQTTGNEQSLDIATFYSSQQWLGVLRDQVVEAVDGSQRRAIPGSPSWHAGLLMFRDMPIPVIDIAQLLDGTAASSGHDVIVTRAPGSNALVGLLVDELGGNPEIAASRVLPMSGITHSHAPAIVDRAIRPENAGDALLCIVNLEHLLLRTQVATVSTVLS
jgi:chemotaxis signal transduction protein